MNYFNQNPAVIKAKMLSMNKQNFIQEAQEIRSVLLDFELTTHNANERFMYLDLYKWCRSVYGKKFAS